MDQHYSQRHDLLWIMLLDDDCNSIYDENHYPVVVVLLPIVHIKNIKYKTKLKSEFLCECYVYLT